MLVYAAGLAVGIAGGFALRGGLKSLGASVHLRFTPVLYGALGLQILAAFISNARLTSDGRFAMVLVSYVTLIVWLAIQAAVHPRLLRISFGLVAAGTLLNFFAIAPNRGIPVSRNAIALAGAPLPTDQRFSVKHVIASKATLFNSLGDIIPLAPLKDVISIGDLVIGLGIAMVISMGMRPAPSQSEPTGSEPSGSEPSGSEPSGSEPTGQTTGHTMEPTIGQTTGANELAPEEKVGNSSNLMSEEIKRASESSVVLSQAMSIADANLAGNVHGGVIMKLVDTAAGLAAVKHAHGRVVTVSMDEMSFLQPVFLTDVVTLRAQVNDAGRTSMEVGVRVEAEDTLSGERRHVSSAYLVFVALDENGRPRPVPRLQAETNEEASRMEDAKIRRKHRIARKEALLQRSAASAASIPTVKEPAVSEPPRPLQTE